MNSSSFWLLAFVFCLSVCHPAFAAPKKNKCTLDPATVRCSTEYTDPVCAFFKGDGCDSKICQRQEPNPCIACVNTPVEYYVKGQCTGDKVYCGYTRPSFCTQEFSLYVPTTLRRVNKACQELQLEIDAQLVVILMSNTMLLVSVPRVNEVSLYNS